jgi:hypothetical protein
MKGRRIENVARSTSNEAPQVDGFYLELTVYGKLDLGQLNQLHSPERLVIEAEKLALT